MIASVSTFSRSIGATRPVWMRNGVMVLPASTEPTDVDEVTLDRSRSGHRRAHEMRAAASALTAFEVAVAGGRAALAGLQPIGVHRQAHRAARLAPLEAGRLEDHVQPFPLGLLL